VNNNHRRSTVGSRIPDENDDNT